MQLPLQVTFRHMDPSTALEADVRAKVEKLQRFCDQIMSCRVMVEAQHQHHHKGHLYHVRVDLKVPGHEIAVSREHDLHHSHADAYVAIRDAFDEVRRQLEDHMRRRRQDVKTHEVVPHGRISALFVEAGYGTIQTADGREIYFHQNSVLDTNFSKLQVGDELRFAEEVGENGPQASSVRLVGKHHPVG
jgi:ribosomal subunit interface protein